MIVLRIPDAVVPSRQGTRHGDRAVVSVLLCQPPAIVRALDLGGYQGGAWPPVGTRTNGLATQGDVVARVLQRPPRGRARWPPASGREATMGAAILVVDDEPALVDVLLAVLALEGYQVRVPLTDSWRWRWWPRPAPICS